MATATVSIVIQADSAAEWTAINAPGSWLTVASTEVVSIGGTVQKANQQRRATLTFPVPFPPVTA
jgi:hypothetical protein